MIVDSTLLILKVCMVWWLVHRHAIKTAAGVDLIKGGVRGRSSYSVAKALAQAE